MGKIEMRNEKNKKIRTVRVSLMPLTFPPIDCHLTDTILRLRDIPRALGKVMTGGNVKV